MGRLAYKQTTTLVCGANPQISGQSIPRKSYQIDPQDVINFNDINESDGSDFSVPGNVVDFPMPFGTVDNGKILVIKPDTIDLTVKIVNAAGISQLITFAAGRLSIWHTTGILSILATNPGGLAITGIMFVAGD